MRAGPPTAAALVLACGLLWAALPKRPAERPPATQPPAAGATRLLWGLALDLNREDARTFEALPGIGPTRARAIRAARPFCAIEDLRRVPGIGPTRFARLRGRVAVPAPPLACRD